MRNAINNMQATAAGFGHVSAKNVFKVLFCVGGQQAVRVPAARCGARGVKPSIAPRSTSLPVAGVTGPTMWSMAMYTGCRAPPIRTHSVRFAGLLLGQVCDQPHPLLAEQIISRCIAGDFNAAHDMLEKKLWSAGYSASDIIGTLFKVTKNQQMDEGLKLKFIRVRPPPLFAS